MWLMCMINLVWCSFVFIWSFKVINLLVLILHNDCNYCIIIMHIIWVLRHRVQQVSLSLDLQTNYLHPPPPTSTPTNLHLLPQDELKLPKQTCPQVQVPLGLLEMEAMGLCRCGGRRKVRRRVYVISQCGPTKCHCGYI